MIWRPWFSEDESSVLRLLQEPMDGKIRLAWGLHRLRCPPGCCDLGGGVLESDGAVVGCGLRWHWPDGSRYLSSLRLSHRMPSLPTPRIWQSSYRFMLEGVGHAWSSIGSDNIRARRLLEGGAHWLPNYYPCQKIISWYVPLAGRKSRASSCPDLNETLGIKSGAFRHVAVVSGRGVAYRLGRIMHVVGLPGIPAPGRSMRIAYAQFPRNHSIKSACDRLLRACRQARGYDGLVVVLPENVELAQAWENIAPPLARRWSSQLYCVSWDKLRTCPPIPDWEGSWL